MSWGTLTVGGLTLKEEHTIEDSTNAQSGVRTVNVNGVETQPPLTLPQIRAKAEDLTAIFGKIVPITFSRKTDRDGYYVIDDVNTSALLWVGEASSFTWSLGLTRIGPDNAVFIESRLSQVLRANDFSLTGEAWHAPAIGHYGYHVGAAGVTPITRVGADGNITVYRNIPAGVNPRWGCSVQNFNNGRVKLLIDGIERFGAGIKAGGMSWELNNGLIRIKPGGGESFLIAVWSDGQWREKSWGFFSSQSVVVNSWDQMTVLRNDNECVTIRLQRNLNPGPGVLLLDLVLRRGSRFVEGYAQRSSAADELKMRLTTAEPSTDNNSYVVASGDDADGNRFVAGSARNFDAHVNGGITKLASDTLDFFVGAVVGTPFIGNSNPGFEGGSTTGWNGVDATVVASQDFAKFGSWSGKLTAAGGASDAKADFAPSTAPVTPGKSYTVSGWLYAPVALPGVAKVGIHWYNGGAFMSSNAASVTLTPGVWTPVTGTFTAPAGATNASKFFAISDNPSAGALLYGDEVRLREATVSGDTASDLMNQYISVQTESTTVVRQ